MTESHLTMLLLGLEDHKQVIHRSSYPLKACDKLREHSCSKHAHSRLRWTILCWSCHVPIRTLGADGTEAIHGGACDMVVGPTFG